MSGGSFNYAYSRLDELSAWVATLEGMAEVCRNEADGRASIVAKAERLEHLAARLRNVAAELLEARQLLHDVEWVQSGDSLADVLEGP